MKKASSIEPIAAGLEIFNELGFFRNRNASGVRELDTDAMMAHTLKCLWALIRHEEAGNTRNSNKSLVFWMAVKTISDPSTRSLVSEIGLKCSSHKALKDNISPLSSSTAENLREQGQQIHSELKGIAIDWLPIYFSAIIENFSEDLCKNIRVTKEHYQLCVEDDEEVAGRTCLEIMLGSHRIPDSNKLNILLILRHQVPWLFYVTSTQNEHPIHYAARKKCSLEVLQLLLKMDPTAVLIRNTSGLFPLHHLLDEDYIESEDFDKFQALFSASGNDPLLASDYSKNTPLALSCQHNAPKTTLVLLQACPAAAAIKNLNNDLPIQLFAGNMDPRHDPLLLLTAFESLLSAYKEAAAEFNNSHVYLLHIVGRYGTVDMVRLAYKAYPDAIKYCDGDDGTPLHQAALGCSVEVVEYLYSLYPEAAQMITDFTDVTVLHFAAKSYPSILTTVYSYNPGAIRKVSHDSGYLPLHELTANFSAIHDTRVRFEMLRFLLKHYPEAAGVRDNSRRTPYDLLPSRDINTELAKRLLLRAAPEVDPNVLRRLNYESRRGALYLLFAAKLPEPRLRHMKQSAQSSVASSDLRRSARQQETKTQPTTVSKRPHPTRKVVSSEIWRLLKDRADVMLWKEIVLYL